MVSWEKKNRSPLYYLHTSIVADIKAKLNEYFQINITWYMCLRTITRNNISDSLYVFNNTVLWFFSFLIRGMIKKDRDYNMWYKKKHKQIYNKHIGINAY